MWRFGVILVTKGTFVHIMLLPFGISPLCKGFEKVKFLLRVMQLTMVKRDQNLARAALPQDLPSEGV